MDPDAALAEALGLARSLTSDEPDYDDFRPGQGASLAEAFLGLHDWLTKGGFLPAAWRVGRSAAEEGGE